MFHGKMRKDNAFPLDGKTCSPLEQFIITNALDGYFKMQKFGCTVVNFLVINMNMSNIMAYYSVVELYFWTKKWMNKF